MTRAEKLAERLQKVMTKKFEQDYSEAIFVRGDHVKFSTEYGCYGAEYYGMKGYAEICDTMEKFADKLDMHWEWENPAIITLYK